MTTTREFFIQRWEAEQAAFRKVLAAMPADQLHYTPHERSTKAGSLAYQLADEQRGIAELLGKQETNYESKPHPDHEAILKLWDEATNEVRDKLKDSSDDNWGKPAKFLYNGNAVWEDSLGAMLWGFLLDMIHHRGQLSAYLRPMGGKVPAIYGPSGDDQGG